MPNPHPRKEFIIPHQFKPKGEKPMSGRLFVRVTPDIEQAVRALPDSPEWLRRVITEAAKRELLGQSPETVSENATPPAAPGSPPLVDADTLVQVLTEVLAAPRLPAAAKKRLESLLERVRERLTQ